MDVLTRDKWNLDLDVLVVMLDLVVHCLLASSGACGSIRSDDILFRRHTSHALQSLLQLTRDVLVFNSQGGEDLEFRIYHKELDGG